VIVPKRLSESWLTVHHGAEKVGYDWVFFEPHKDGTAWFERRLRFTAGDLRMDTHMKARFTLRRPKRGREKEPDGREGWPDLRWCRFREGEATQEIVGAGSGEVPAEGATLLALPEDALPSYVLPLVAATSRLAPGERSPFTVLWESERRLEPGHALVCDGPEELEIASGERLAVTRLGLEREGKRWCTYWVDDQRRVRKIDSGGPFSLLSTRAEAEAAAAARGLGAK
jgi:hypothetical protein